MKFFTAYACAWMATSLVVMVGLYLTRNANCLWAFFFPLCISGSSRKE